MIGDLETVREKLSRYAATARRRATTSQRYESRHRAIGMAKAYEHAERMVVRAMTELSKEVFSVRDSA